MGEGFRRRHRVVNAVQALIHEFPVVDGAGRLRGVLTHDAMIRSLMEHGPDVAVTEVMTRDIPITQPAWMRLCACCRRQDRRSSVWWTLSVGWSG